MAKEIEHFDATGLTLYAKPVPIQTGTWAADAVTVAEDVGVAGYYYADIVTPAAEYTLFLQAGGSPADTDTPIARVVISVLANNMRGTDNALLAAGYTAPSNASIAAIKAITDLITFSGGRVDSALADADGISETLFREVLMAFAVGPNMVTEIGPNERQVEFKKQDGTTVVITITYDPADGQRVGIPTIAT